MELTINTSKDDEIVDITDELNKLIYNSSNKNGVLHVFVKHTTCAITTADLDPGTDQDFLKFLRKISPELTYNHPHDPKHTPDHLLSSLIGPFVAVPFKNKELELGTWQRIVLVELNGPRKRSIICSII